MTSMLYTIHYKYLLILVTMEKLLEQVEESMAKIVKYASRVKYVHMHRNLETYN